jgi:hypothetical protein
LYQIEYEDGDREELVEIEVKKILAIEMTAKPQQGRMFNNGMLVKKVCR